jgi:hypothetical protein
MLPRALKLQTPSILRVGPKHPAKALRAADGLIKFSFGLLGFLLRAFTTGRSPDFKPLLWIWDYNLSLLKHEPFELFRIAN